MVPVHAFMTMEKVYGPEEITSYNHVSSAMVNGNPATGLQ